MSCARLISLSAARTLSNCEVKRLNTDHIDLYFVHMDDAAEYRYGSLTGIELSRFAAVVSALAFVIVT
jgi:aryl-alcohol dehydrogenase-like predicted oxidoreductase